MLHQQLTDSTHRSGRRVMCFPIPNHGGLPKRFEFLWFSQNVAENKHTDTLQFFSICRLVRKNNIYKYIISDITKKQTHRKKS